MKPNNSHWLLSHSTKIKIRLYGTVMYPAAKFYQFYRNFILDCFFTQPQMLWVFCRFELHVKTFSGCEIQTLISGNPEANSKKGEDETEDSDEDEDEEGLVDHNRRERSEDGAFSGIDNEDVIADTVAKQNRKRRKSSAAVSNLKQREKLFEYHPMSVALEFTRQGIIITFICTLRSGSGWASGSRVDFYSPSKLIIS